MNYPQTIQGEVTFCQLSSAIFLLDTITLHSAIPRNEMNEKQNT